MFSDPISISVGQTNALSGGTAKSMARIRTDGYASEYSTSDGLYVTKITHSRNSRLRTEVRLDFTTPYTDPTTGLVTNIVASAYLVLNRPPAGFSNTQLSDIITGVGGWTTQAANITKLLGLES